MSSPYKLVHGPIFGARFVQCSWLNFHDEHGRSGFDGYSQSQLLSAVVSQKEGQRNIDYASIIQLGSWD